jgi:hypothetical protein
MGGEEEGAKMKNRSILEAPNSVSNLFSRGSNLASPKILFANNFFALIFKTHVNFKGNSVLMFLIHLHLTHHKVVVKQPFDV